MLTKRLCKRLAVLALASVSLLTVGCSPTTQAICCAEWQVEHNFPCYPPISAARLYQKGSNILPVLDLEIVRYDDEIEMYLNLICRQIDDCAVEVGVAAECWQATYCAPVFEGGQRLLLPPEAAVEIIGALLEAQTLTLQVDGRTTEIQPGNFAIQYERFLSNRSDFSWTSLVNPYE